jgi:membrane fusion protein, multidrug efflux system
MPFPPLRRAPRPSIVLLVALAAGPALLACSKDNAAEAADSSSVRSAAAPGGDDAGRSLSLPVAADVVRDGDLVLSVVTTGQVRSEGESKLKAEIAGTVSKVLVRPGDRVRTGQPLVQLDRRPFDLAVQEAEATVKEAELKYYDNIGIDSVASGRPPTEQRRLLAEVRAGLPSARIRLEKAKLDLERASIVSPYDGVVDRVDVADGERVAAGQPITTIVDLDHLRIETAVLEHDLPLIKVGGQAIVSSAAAPDRRTIGLVTAVLPLVDSASRAGRAYVRAPGSAYLRPGMYADVRLEAQRLPNRRLVPAKAVIERDGRPLVFVVKDGRAQWTYITPGRTNGIDTEVLPDSGTGLVPLNPGDEVIVEGHLTLTHDAPVRVVAAAKPEIAGERLAGTAPAKP